MIGPATLAELMADPGELDVSCLDCHHNATMPVAALLPRTRLKPRSPKCGAGSAVRPVGQGMWTFGRTGRPAKRPGR
jgi:hypothetical protein